MISISIDTQEGDPPPLSNQRTESAIRAVCTLEKCTTGHIHVIFTDDNYLSDLKKNFFGLEQYTDVMAFNLNAVDEPLEGEIYISVERAAENAPLFGETHSSELERLVVHGTLHLLGWADDTADEQRAIRAAENQAIAMLRKIDAA